MFFLVNLEDPPFTHNASHLHCNSPVSGSAFKKNVEKILQNYIAHRNGAWTDDYDSLRFSAHKKHCILNSIILIFLLTEAREATNFGTTKQH